MIWGKGGFSGILFMGNRSRNFYIKTISKGETNFKLPYSEIGTQPPLPCLKYNFKLEDLLKTYMQLFEFKVGVKYRRLFSMTSL